MPLKIINSNAKVDTFMLMHMPTTLKKKSKRKRARVISNDSMSTIILYTSRKYVPFNNSYWKIKNKKRGASPKNLTSWVGKFQHFSKPSALESGQLMVYKRDWILIYCTLSFCGIKFPANNKCPNFKWEVSLYTSKFFTKQAMKWQGKIQKIILELILY